MFWVGMGAVPAPPVVSHAGIFMLLYPFRPDTPAAMMCAVLRPLSNHLLLNRTKDRVALGIVGPDAHDLAVL
jgi:hypothetical protein